MREQRRFVLDKLVEATIERVLLDQRKIFAEQIAHGALLEPQPVQTPFAGWIDEPVADQRLKDVAPAGPFARIGQTSRPEAVERQLLIELAGEPARAPLPRPMQLHGPEPDLHAIALGVIGQRSIGGEQGQLSGLLRPLVEGLDHPAPGFLLAVVDLAEIKHLPLHHLAAGAALALDNAPVAVLLAVLEASIRAQIHGETNLRQTIPRKRYLVSTTGEFRNRIVEPTRFSPPPNPKIHRLPAPVEKVGLDYRSWDPRDRILQEAPKFRCPGRRFSPFLQWERPFRQRGAMARAHIRQTNRSTAALFPTL